MSDPREDLPGFRAERHDRFTYLIPEEGQERCDFCLMLRPEPSWTYPTAPMELESPTRNPIQAVFDGTDDDWLVCQACHELVQSSGIGALVERIVNLQPMHRPADEAVYYPPVPLRRRAARQNVLRFMDARRGPPTRN